MEMLLLFSRHVQLFVTLWSTACQASLSLTIAWNLPKFMAIELVMTTTYQNL